jgi:nucleotide-binding universal stress UspA family protein
MIKKILLAIDSDQDSNIAAKYAINLARRHDALVNCLAVIDLQSIESSTRGGGIGSFYYAEKLQEKLTDETRTLARKLMAEYEQIMVEAGIRHGEFIREGVPFERIVEDMKVHDILIVGKDPHFFYAHPKKDTHTVARVVKRTIAPTLVVDSVYRDVKRVVIAYDGSDAAARAISRFVHLQPFGQNVAVDLLSVYQKDSSDVELMLNLMKEFISEHGFACNSVALSGSRTSDEIIKYVDETSTDLLVAGAHAVSAIKRITFGSTTAGLMSNCTIPVFLDN